MSALTLSFIFLFLIFSPPLPASSTLCNKEDKKALLAFKAAFAPSPFPSWTSTSPCCEWYGVDCNDTTGRVIGLDIIDDDTLTGAIPSAVGNLPFLQTLIFHKLPKLVGPIPSSITKLSNLTILILSWNGLSGRIPPFLSEITSLSFLTLAFNNFTGSIPPSLANLPNLLALHLDRNRLTGSIPDSFGNFPKSSPPDLYLSHNNLSGPIPTSLGEVEWGIIDFSRNQLTGDGSVLFGSAKPTTQIDLSRNRLSFDLTHASFPVNLTLLDLNHNMIYGGIPDQINEVTGLINQVIGLTVFNVSYNRLCGEIPGGSVTSHFDQYSYFHNKCLCGPPLAACK